MNSEVKPNIYGYPLELLRKVLVENGLPKFNADQVYNWAYRNFKFDSSEWTNIGKKTLAFINENFDTTVPKIVWDGLSKDGTRKFLLAMSDGKTVEAVAIPARDRLTLCLSSQVGCAIGCTFCHTGTMGLTRHLQAGEIVGQYLAVQKFLTDKNEPRLSNIVYMGQGEPLHNYDNVKASAEVFLEPKGLGLSQRKVTLSTSGLVPQIEKLLEFPPVNIAISLHAAHDDIRTELMPINKRYDLGKLFEAIKSIPLKAHRRITYEYILIKDLNDRPEDIDGLIKLLPKKESKINIIPFNEYPESEFKKPDNETIKWFMDELNRRGIVTTVRATKGDDILAACGQLKSHEEKGKLNLWS